MQTNSSVRGISNGHWEHIEAPSFTSRIVLAAQQGLNRLLSSIRQRDAHASGELHSAVH